MLAWFVGQSDERSGGNPVPLSHSFGLQPLSPPIAASQLQNRARKPPSGILPTTTINIMPNGEKGIQTRHLSGRGTERLSRHAITRLHLQLFGNGARRKHPTKSRTWISCLRQLTVEFKSYMPHARYGVDMDSISSGTQSCRSTASTDAGA